MWLETITAKNVNSSLKYNLVNVLDTKNRTVSYFRTWSDGIAQTLSFFECPQSTITSTGKNGSNIANVLKNSKISSIFPNTKTAICGENSTD